MRSSLTTSNVRLVDLGLNFLVQICQELGQPYEEYNAQFIRLKRAQEAEEDAGFNFGQGGENDGYQQQNANVYQPQGGFYQQQQDENNYQQTPSNRVAQAQPQRQAAPPKDEAEGWGNDEDLLPD